MTLLPPERHPAQGRLRLPCRGETHRRRPRQSALAVAADADLRAAERPQDVLRRRVGGRRQGFSKMICT